MQALAPGASVVVVGARSDKVESLELLDDTWTRVGNLQAIDAGAWKLDAGLPSGDLYALNIRLQQRDPVAIPIAISSTTDIGLLIVRLE